MSGSVYAGVNPVFLGCEYARELCRRFDAYSKIEWKIIQMINWCNYNNQDMAEFQFSLFNNGKKIIPERYEREGFHCSVNEYGFVMVTRIQQESQ